MKGNEKLRNLIKERGLKIGSLAAAIGLKDMTLYGIVSGRNKLTADICKKLANYLHVPMEDLVDDNE